jgi:D-alanyl-D-alanine carboxypeptidase
MTMVALLPILDHKLSIALQAAMDRWQLFCPCLGANATLEHSRLGRWDGAAGYRDPDTRAPMAVDGRFYVYSITKTFTAICVVQLAERRALDLDAPLAAYLALAFPQGVTVRRLLNHTAGVPSYTDLRGYLPANRDSPGAPWPEERVLELTCSGKLDFEPGRSWHYSNTGYLLLRRLIESVTGRSFADNVRERIAVPLGFESTYVAKEIDDRALVPGFSRDLNDDDRMENVIPRYHPGWCYTGLVVSTTAETVKLYRSLFSGMLVGAASLAEMKSSVPCADEGGFFFKRPAYGLGLMVDEGWNYGGLYGHGGEGAGYNTWAMHLPDFHGGSLTLAVFCNTSFARYPYYLVKDLLRVLEERSA